MRKSSYQAGLQLLEDEDFVWGRVWPLVSSGESRQPRSTFRLTAYRRRQDGRVVAEYSFNGRSRVFAKLYPDAAEGHAVHRIQDVLWRQGFGPASPYRVPEPIGYLGEHGVLLMQPAGGNRFAGAETRDREGVEEGARRAASWLVALHESPLRLGPGESVAQGAFRLAGRAMKAAACRPDLEDVFRRAIAELGRRCGTVAEPRAQVQTHGRYHADHVFLAPQFVTVVDLDRAALADPAKDVGEFLHALRWEGAKRRWHNDAVEDACEAFLDEYVRHRPGVLSELAYYWSYSVLWALLGLAFRRRSGRTAWSARSEFLRAEFDGVPRRAAGWLRHGERGPGE